MHDVIYQGTTTGQPRVGEPHAISEWKLAVVRSTNTQDYPQLSTAHAGSGIQERGGESHGVSEHRLCVLDRRGERLFIQDVGPCCRGLLHQPAVSRVPGRNDDRIGLLVEYLRVAVDVCDAESGGKLGAARSGVRGKMPIWVTGDQLDVVSRGQQPQVRIRDEIMWVFKSFVARFVVLPMLWSLRSPQHGGTRCCARILMSGSGACCGLDPVSWTRGYAASLKSAVWFEYCSSN